MPTKKNILIGVLFLIILGELGIIVTEYYFLHKNNLLNTAKAPDLINDLLPEIIGSIYITFFAYLVLFFLRKPIDAYFSDSENSTFITPELNTKLVSIENLIKEMNQIETTNRLAIKDLELIQTLKEIGITDATSKLQNSKFEPKECLNITRRKLSFMGISGAKWVNSENNNFESFLRKIDSLKDGEVNFLLLDPSCDSYKKLKKLREGYLEGHEEILANLSKLSSKYDCLKVRLYSSLPSFRLIKIDENTIVLSRYRLDKEGYIESNKGWNNPHIEFSENSKWSFFDIFNYYFLDIWNTSKELKEFSLEKDVNITNSNK